MSILWIHEDEFGGLRVLVDGLEGGHEEVLAYGCLDHLVTQRWLYCFSFLVFYYLNL